MSAGGVELCLGEGHCWDNITQEDLSLAVQEILTIDRKVGQSGGLGPQREDFKAGDGAFVSLGFTSVGESFHEMLFVCCGTAVAAPALIVKDNNFPPMPDCRL